MKYNLTSSPISHLHVLCSIVYIIYDITSCITEDYSQFILKPRITFWTFALLASSCADVRRESDIRSLCLTVGGRKNKLLTDLKTKKSKTMER